MMLLEGHFLHRNGAMTGRTMLIGFVCASVLVVAGSDSFAQSRRAQVDRESTKELMDYSNSFGTDGDFERPRPSDKRNLLVGGQVDSKLLRQQIHAFKDSLAQLIYDLNDQSSKLAGVRPVYLEALRLSGSVEAIEKHVAKHDVDSALLDELQQADADWRELVYRLGNLRGLSEDSKQLVEDLNGIGQKMRETLGIQPQLDRRQLTLKAAGLASSLEGLQEDITFELGRSQDTQFYRRSIGRARNSVLNLISLVRDPASDANVMISEFKQFETIWTPLVNKLHAEDDRYIERGLTRVAAASNEIHQLLLLPQKVDQTQFVYLTKALKKDVDEFFLRTPLVLVMQLENSKLALPAADQLHKACDRFVEVVQNGQDQPAIIEAFRKIEQAEKTFFDVYRDVDSDRAAAVLTRIDQSVASLRSALQIHRDDFDARAAADLAASVQNLTEQIALVSKRWLDKEDPSFEDDCLRQVGDLADSAARLHDDIADGKRASDLKDGMLEVYEGWRTVYGYLVKCQTEERATLGRLATRLTPAIVDLRAIVIP